MRALQNEPMKNKRAREKTDPESQVEFLPVRWWQMVPFLHLNFELVREIDPLAERILSHPWAPSSLLEYAYMSGTFLRSITHFITASGKQAGVAWTYYRARIGFILSVGILRQFRRAGMGMQTIDFIENYVRDQGGDALVAVMAIRNKPVRWLARAVGGHSLGLATATLMLPNRNLSTSHPAEITIKRIGKQDAVKRWKRWRLYEVEHVAGGGGVEIAARLLEAYRWLETLPRGGYFALYQNGQEIGFANMHQRKSQVRLELFPSNVFWSGPRTADLIAALTPYFPSPVDCLILTQTHADALTADTPFEFERHKENERLYAFKFI
jgi:GNAT superfamily N-acetyltransferase